MLPRFISRRYLSSEPLVKFQIENKCGIITLNRQKAINALNLEMVRLIYPKLKDWSKDSQISHILIEGAGTKGFCAGGDVQSVVKSPIEEASKFFFEEYRLNHLTSCLKKPYIAIIDGIVMGGGVGLSVHGPFRVSTERSLFAMPETLIGLFPDVGGGHFLPRLPHKGLGLYLALTGYRLKGSDLKHAGISTHHINSSDLDNLKTELKMKTDDNKPVNEILDKFSTPNLPPFTLEGYLGFIQKHFSLDHKTPNDYSDVEILIDKLKKESFSGNEFATKTLEQLNRMSPLSLKITYRQLLEGSSKSLEEVLKMEYRMAIGCLRSNDFREGVRALLIDKDNSPNWSPIRLDHVTSRCIEKFFSPLADEWHLEKDL